jgi:hypothetical protein
VKHLTIRQALRVELESHGLDVGGDTAGIRGDLYVRGANDLAAALFEFKSTADEACITMYQGRWLAHLPPRFAVLPWAQKGDPALEMLTQSGLSVLFYEEFDGKVTFPEICEAVASFRS